MSSDPAQGPASAADREDSGWLPPEIDTSVAHPARRYDYWLGGKDHFAADRASGDAIAAAFPAIRTTVIENRRFLGRAVEFLARDLGISQFLDVGTGLPAANNTHQVAQRINPSSRVVYVDNDPIVLAHARALLANTHQDGATAYLDADLRRPETILGDPVLAATLDLTRPVALMLIAVLHFVLDEHKPYAVVRRLVEALPAGSYLVMTHATNDYMPAETSKKVDQAETRARVDFRFRTREEFARFFDGSELLPPGIVPFSEWRAEREPRPRPRLTDVAGYGAIGRIQARG